MERIASRILPAAHLLKPGTWLDIQQRGEERIRRSASLTKKMDNKRTEFRKNFHEEVASVLADGVFTPSTASLQDHIGKGHGDLLEGIRTNMKIGDLELFGAPEDAPEESSVDADFAYFYEGKTKIPITQLLPTLTVSGTEDTKPGCWRVLFESEKSRLWAFLRMLAEMQQAALVGSEQQGDRCKKIMTDLLDTLPVVIVKMQAEDELWAEWSRSQTTGHTDLQHSTDRISNRFTFFAKLKQTLKKKLKDNLEKAEVTTKKLFEAYLDAEKEQKFRTAKGMTAVKRDNELSQLMKWGEFITKIGHMSCWRDLEVLLEGKTSFFTPTFGNIFCGLIENDEDIAKYVLNTLTACILEDEKWRKRVMEANATRMKSIVKTLVLQWKWAKNVFETCKTRPIMPAEKTTNDFALLETVFSRTEALQVMADSTGKKANLHPLSRELLDTCHKVLVEQAHFNVFQAAEAMNKNFENTIHIEALQNLCVPNIQDPWKDTHAQFAGQGMIVDAAGHEDAKEIENKAETASHMQLPTRKEAIKVAAQNELTLYHGTSFVKTGDTTQDRQRFFASELAKPRTAQTAQWNPETQGNRRGTMYDESGRRNPKWTYVKGRNRFRSKISFQKDDYDEFADVWAIMAKPGESSEGVTPGEVVSESSKKKNKVDVLMVWNAEQERANAVIMKKMKSMPGMDGQVKKTLLKGLQAHVERRLWDKSPDGEVGELAGLPGMQEELFEVFAGPLPSRRKHNFPMGGITDNMYPEEIVPLRNPKQSEPLVSVEVQKAIFPPDDDKAHDGEKSVRSDEVWAPCHVCSCFLY